MSDIRITLVGGPTALIELAGFRLLTDPTFDSPREYRLPHVTLRKLTQPAISASDIGHVDAVLLSHDQHADNLDASGRDYVREARRVLTTTPGASRLGGSSEGLGPWNEATIDGRDGRRLTIVATPARHGPSGIEPLAGDVIGFVLRLDGEDAVYVTGDTVWYEGTAEIARRFSPRVVLVFAGAARTRGPLTLTMDTNDVLDTAHAFPAATIVPLHCDGWAHFSQGRTDIEAAFGALGLASRLSLLEPGATVEIPF
jgi:L-ascorbate metabolism protein UlaG (beta-lactamase superfamily)